MRRPVPALSLATCAVAMTAVVPSTFAQGLPARFVDEAVLTGLDAPTVVRFHPDGRVFVAEKGGAIRIFDALDDPTPDTFVDLADRVHDYWDRGLLGMALHPDFDAEPYVYVLYTLDARPGESPPAWGDQCPNPPGGTGDGCIVQGRLSRFRANGNSVDGAEEVLIQNWCQQFPSHSIGALQFGADGALYATGGDGASFNYVDYGQSGNPQNPCGDPPVAVGALQQPPQAEGGALRAQSLRGSGTNVSLDGTLLRLDPATGAGLPNNPLYGGGNASDDGIVAFGLRNPFRFALRPGTSEVWIGDVGWNSWEEIDVVADPLDGVIENFGWPCYEGSSAQGGYDSANLTLCESLYSNAGAHSQPEYAYNHGAHVVSGDQCATGSSAVTGLAFYDGSVFPAEYAGALFFADYSRDCIWTMLPDAAGRPDPTRRRLFRRGAPGPIDLTVGPDGSLYYVALRDGSVRRIRYANETPLAVIDASPLNGVAPLSVQLDGTASSDPDDDPLTYAWDLDGDGFDDSTEASFTHVFTTPGEHTVRLRVTDTIGLSHIASVSISVDNTPPVAFVDAPLSTLAWRVGDVIDFSGHADDPQEGPLAEGALSWEIILHHCTGDDCHPHVVMGLSGVAAGSFPAPDHEYPSYLEIVVTATDSLGLTGIASVVIQPETAMLLVESDPSGLSVAIDSREEPTPFGIEAIVGSQHTVGANSPQLLLGEQYQLDAWSDGGDASHLVTLEAGGSTLSVHFTESCGNGELQAGETCDDANRVDGDCCSSACQLEPEGAPCADDSDRCTLDRCDGAGACVHPASGDCAGLGESCTDDLGCESEHCVGSRCCEDACDDGDPCTEDGCASDGSCAPTAIPGCGIADAGPAPPDASPGMEDAGETPEAGTPTDAAVDAAVDAATGAMADAGAPTRDAASAPNGGASEGDASAEGSVTEAGDAGGPDMPDPDDDCSCSLPGATRDARTEPPKLLALVPAVALWRRRRRARR